jgi:excisionase family DNA binding protein
MQKPYTVRMVADLLQRHENTVYKWVQEGILPAFRINRGWYIKERDVRRLLKDARPPRPTHSQGRAVDPH